MKISKILNVKSRDNEFLKCHYIKDEDWTANDLIDEYKYLREVCEKDSEMKKLQKEVEESIEAEKYIKLKKERKEKIAELKIISRGDIQRTKNIFGNFLGYMRMYQNKQSHEIIADLNLKTFFMRRTLDCRMAVRKRLMQDYEDYLLKLANKQEIIRFNDIKEFQQEQDVKRLYVELKNSETRGLSMRKINSTYKSIIQQLLHDTLYYQPVLEALNGKWNEQTRLIKHSLDIGIPAIKHVKKFEKEVNKLTKLREKEEAEKFKDLSNNRQILKQDPKLVTKLVRRDSDFMLLNDRYDKETSSMKNLRLNTQSLYRKIFYLKSPTHSKISEESIIPRAAYMMSEKNRLKQVATNDQINYQHLRDQRSIYFFIQKMLLDEHPYLLNGEAVNEVSSLQNIVNAEKENQKVIDENLLRHRKGHTFIVCALHHLLDIFRHIKPKNLYGKVEYPNAISDLELPLLRFFKVMPQQTQLFDTNIQKIMTLIKSKVRVIMQYYNKKRGNISIKENVPRFYKAVVEDVQPPIRPRVDTKEKII